MNPRILFGSMRMSEHDVGTEHWVSLFNFMYNEGISIHHVSGEYESFVLYCEVLTEFRKKFPRKRIQHIVKLAEPNFQDTEFCEETFFRKINEYRTSLNCSVELFGIQWMWRNNLKDDNLRCIQFSENIDLIDDSVRKAKSLGLIQNFFVFPYTVQFANTVLRVESEKNDFFDGFIVYRNFHELEYDDILKYSAKNHYILRPFNAGKVLENSSPKEALNFALNHANVAGSIVSISSINRFIEFT